MWEVWPFCFSLLKRSVVFRQKKSVKKMEVEEEHPLLQRMRRAAEKLCNHHGDDSDDDAEKLASILRSAREIFTTAATIQTTTEVNAKDCVRVRWSPFSFLAASVFARARVFPRSVVARGH